MWPGPRPTFVPSAIFIHPAVWPQQTWAKNFFFGGGNVPLGGGAGSASNTMLTGPRLNHRTKWHLDPSSCLATTNMGQKLGVPLFWGGGTQSPSSTMWPGRGLPPYQVASLAMQPFGHNRPGPKIGGSVPFLGRGAGSPSNTMSLGSRPTSIASGILIHPAIWAQ